MIPFPEIEKIAEPTAAPVEHAAQWWWWAAAGLLALVVAALVVWLLVAAARRAMVPGAPVRPEKLALRELKSLRKRSAALSDPEFGTALSAVVRSFLHRRMGLFAHFATTQEILGQTRRRDEAPPPPLTAAFSSVLEGCDALKFGGGAAGNREPLLAAAEAAVQAVSAALRHAAPAATIAPPPLPQTDAPAA